MGKLKNLEDFLMDELKDIYSSEKQITKALPKMAKAATSPELKKAFLNHLKETENQIKRLDKISKLAGGRSLSGKKCVATEGLLEEGKELMQEDATPEVMDVALICAGQKVEHYEIATYGCAATYARLLGYTEVEKLLNETLEEEKNADVTLSTIADSLNPEALSGGDEESSKPKKTSRKK